MTRLVRVALAFFLAIVLLSSGSTRAPSPAAADDCRVDKPAVSVTFPPGSRTPTFAWTSQCRGIVTSFWFYYVDGAMTYRGESGPITGDRITPPMPDDPGIDSMSFFLVNQRYNANGTWSQREDVGFIVQNGTGLAIPTLPPAAPGPVTVVDSGEQRVSVSWGESPAPGGPGLTYVVTTSPPTRGCTVEWATSCLLTGLRYGVAYTVSVTARNSTGESTPVAAPPITLRAPAPTQPRSVVAEVEARTSAGVTWLAPLDAAFERVSNYVVTATPGGGTCRTRSLSCTVTDLAPGQRYTFTVKATRAGTVGKASPPSPAIRMPAPPPPPAPPAPPPNSVAVPTAPEPAKPAQPIT